MEDSKYCISIGEVKEDIEGYSKKHRIELDNDAAMVVIKTPDWVMQTALCNVLKVLHEDMNKGDVYIRELNL